MEVSTERAVTVYWAPGCSSCLRVKEYLGSHGIDYRSRNIHTDPTAIADLATFGVRRVPIVTKDGAWVDGQALREVAALCGIAFESQAGLPVDTLAKRVAAILAETQRVLPLFDERMLSEEIRDGKRSYADLVFHVFSVVDVFIEHEAGAPVTFASYQRMPAPDRASREALSAFGADVSARMADWLAHESPRCSWNDQADVYYGEQTKRQFFERTTWHAGQHLRQLLWRLDHENDRGLLNAAKPLFAGLPMPNAVWHSDAE